MFRLKYSWLYFIIKINVWTGVYYTSGYVVSTTGKNHLKKKMYQILVRILGKASVYMPCKP